MSIVFLKIMGAVLMSVPQSDEVAVFCLSMGSAGLGLFSGVCWFWTELTPRPLFVYGE